ncbi:hypothetical protein [Streptomyces sp. URMC 129]|uniref:hypothetical protein n=1 Tax=Streptomyces sp. URMC 129 TaxID=3423407 RepID=UPI003F1BFFB5
MLAQRKMRHEAHETLHFTAALDLIADITGAITADALHTVADHTPYLHSRGAFGLFPVKQNRAALFTQLDALDWDGTTTRRSPQSAPRRSTQAATRSVSCASSPWPRGR